jgi:hypothetical protein
VSLAWDKFHSAKRDARFGVHQRELVVKNPVFLVWIGLVSTGI